jgi:hypothetical protein
MGDSEYLTDRIPDLNNQGSEKNMLYYATEDVKVQEVQFDINQGRYNQSLTSKTFGSTSEITIPNQDSVSSVYLYLSLAHLIAGLTLCDGWGYAAIRSVNFTWGSSTISQVELSGESIWQHNHLCCETLEKRNKMVELSGNSYLNSGGSDPHEACIQIPLPWSTIRASKDKLPYDSSLLSTNINVQITFNDANHFIGQATTPAKAYPNDFIRADVLLKQSVLSNKADSMKMTLMRNPNLLISYPFTHKQNGTRHFFNGVIGESVELQLQSFLEADLLGISFMIVPTKDERSASVLSTSNKWNSLRCRDIELLYNGQIIHSFPYHSAELSNLGIDPGSPDINVSLVNTTGGTDSGKTSSGIDLVTSKLARHIYYLPLTPCKSVIFESEFYNTSRYAQQTMSIRLQVEYPTGLLVTEQLSFRPVYYYNAMCSTSKGVSTLTFA